MIEAGTPKDISARRKGPGWMYEAVEQGRVSGGWRCRSISRSGDGSNPSHAALEVQAGIGASWQMIKEDGEPGPGGVVGLYDGTNLSS